MAQLARLSPEQLRQLPDDAVEEIWIGGRPATLTTYRESVTGGVLLAVQGFTPTWRWPTVISTRGIGHVVAEGLLLTDAEALIEADDEMMWSYR